MNSLIPELFINFLPSAFVTIMGFKDLLDKALLAHPRRIYE
jgi:hypothetical protein